MEKLTNIYGLKEKEGIIRYIGKSDNINLRLKHHILESKRLNKTRKHKWINKAIKNNIEIEVVCLEIVDYEIWQEKEIYWIDKYKSNDLTNHSKGGLGGGLKKYTITYNETKEWVKKKLPNIKSQISWNRNKKNLPEFIPKKPDLVFKNTGWLSWGKFLNTNNLFNNNREFISLNETKEWIKNNTSLFSQNDWNEWVKNNEVPIFIPKAPEHVYKNLGWISWGDFLNTNNQSTILVRKNMLPLKELKKIAKKNNIKSKDEWVNYVKNNNNKKNLPLKPQKFHGWVSWYDFLDKKKKNFVDLEEAINILKEYELKSYKDWRIFIKKDIFEKINIPKNPDFFYKNKGWINWAEFLGYN